MSGLDGFYTFNFDVGVASASITPNGITFNRSVAMKLNYPEYVTLLINEESKQIAIKVCDSSTLHATSFYKEKHGDEAVRSVRWNNRELLNTLSEMMGWDLKQISHRVDRKFLPQEHAMLFDLTKATDMK